MRPRDRASMDEFTKISAIRKSKTNNADRLPGEILPDLYQAYSDLGWRSFLTALQLWIGCSNVIIVMHWAAFSVQGSWDAGGFVYR